MVETLQIEDVKVSSGVEAAEGDIVTLQYQVALSEDGLESGDWIEARDETDPIELRLTSDELFEPLVEALRGMRDGGSIRRVVLGQGEGFGARGLDDRVPPHSPLYVQIWLRKVLRT